MDIHDIVTSIYSVIKTIDIVTKIPGFIRKTREYISHCSNLNLG